MKAVKAMKESLRIIDLGQGPRVGYATRLLAGFGADVIKVEPPGSGDAVRGLGPFPNDRADPEYSGVALYLDAGKRSICIDLDCEDGRDILSCLLDTADVVIDETSQEQALSLGLNLDAMESNWPQLIRTSISPFGMDGPNCDLEAPTLILEALCGWLFLSGEPQRAPSRIRGELASAVIPGVYATIGTLAAINWREVHGEGQLVEISAQESMLSASRFYETTYAQRGVEVQRVGSALYATYAYKPAKDGWVALCTATAEQREMLAILTGLAEHIDDPLFQIVDESAENSPLRTEYDNWVATHERKDIFHQAQELRVPAGYVSDALDVLSLPQLLAREALTTQSTPGSGTITFPGAPFRMSGLPFKAHRAPHLGEHTREILSIETNLSDREIENLYHRGIVA